MFSAASRSASSQSIEIRQFGDERVDEKSFNLLKVLGTGAYGKVYLVQKIDGFDAGKPYAMKVLRKATIETSEKTQEHTKAERTILEAISSSPFLVHLHYAFQTNDKLHLILDYVSGGELFSLHARERSFSEENARLYVAEVTLALQFLHDLGIIYRDIKLENILLDSSGHIVLTDFGLSKEVYTDTQRAFSYVGTVEYMAPEIASEQTALEVCGAGEAEINGDYVVVSGRRCEGEAARYRQRLGEFTIHRKTDGKWVVCENWNTLTPLYMASGSDTLGHVPPKGPWIPVHGSEPGPSVETVEIAGHTMAVDWWSLGILLYELVFGRTPFAVIGDEADEEDEQDVILQRILHEEPNYSKIFQNNPDESKRTYSSAKANALSSLRQSNRVKPGEVDTCWYAEKDQIGEWLIMDLGSIHNVKGVVTQGNVTSFTVSVSDDGVNFKGVPGVLSVESGATYDSTFAEVYRARYVKIVVLKWDYCIKMRAAVRLLASTELVDCISQLLKKNPEHRLGYGPEDAKSIMRHAFFHGLDWNKVKEKHYPAPFEPPPTTDVFDTSNFDETFTSQEARYSHPTQEANDHKKPLLFRGFSFVAPSILFEKSHLGFGLAQHAVSLGAFREKYELIDSETLGVGSFSICKKCVLLNDCDIGPKGKAFACKIISARKGNPAREVELLKRCAGHPNIIELVDYFHDDVHHYVIMPLMSGGELLERIRSKERFSEVEAGNIFRKMIDAVAFMHRNGIVHRDIKPENLLYDGPGEDAELKIIDFGFAREMSVDSKALKTPCMTIGYAAPEVLGRVHPLSRSLSRSASQLSFSFGYDKSCDLWSLGVILYTMLSGYPPFHTRKNMSADEILSRIQQSELHFAEAQWAGVSDEAKDLVSGLLTINSVARLTADQAATHPWLSTARPKLERDGSDLLSPAILKDAHNMFETSLLKRKRSVPSGIGRSISDVTPLASTSTFVTETLHVVQGSNLKGDQSVLAPMSLSNSSLKLRRTKRNSTGSLEAPAKLVKAGSKDDVHEGMVCEMIESSPPLRSASSETREMLSGLEMKMDQGVVPIPESPPTEDPSTL